MKAAIKYLLFLCICLAGLGARAHAAVADNRVNVLSAREESFSKQLALVSLDNKCSINNDQHPGDQDESIFNDEDDDDDCITRKHSTLVKYLIAFSSTCLSIQSIQNSCCLLPFSDNFSFTGYPRYITQRVIRI